MPPKILPLLACSLAATVLSLSPLRAADSNAASTTLLDPRTISYARSGGYDLTITPSWSTLTFDLFTPQAASRNAVRFGDLALSYAGNSSSHTTNLSYGQVWRTSLSQNRVLGFNAYVNLGKRPEISSILAQTSVGLEYEIAHLGGWRGENLIFGSNVYLPFQDYTALRYDTDVAVPRQGLDSYVSWTHNVDDELDLGATFSLFHYTATDTRASRGIGTLAFTGSFSGGLPAGTTLESSISGRFGPDQDSVPTVSLSLNFSEPVPTTYGQTALGSLVPSRNCRIVPSRRRIDRLDCGPSSYSRPGAGSRLISSAHAPISDTSVPAPERFLGYSSPYVP